MIGIPPGVRVLVATRPVDFSKGAETLSPLRKEALGQDAFAGTVLIFRAKRTDRAKILFHDGMGLCLFWKALDQGAFRWPNRPLLRGRVRPLLRWTAFLR